VASLFLWRNTVAKFYDRKLGLKNNVARNSLPAWFNLKTLPVRAKALRSSSARAAKRKQRLYYVTHRAAISDAGSTYRRLNKHALHERAQQLAVWRATPIGVKYKVPTVSDPTFRRSPKPHAKATTALARHVAAVKRNKRHR